VVTYRDNRQMGAIGQEKTKMQQVINLSKHQSVLRPTDLKSLGLPPKYLQRLEQEGILQRIGRGLYQTSDAEISEHQSLLEAARQIPNGVVALLSALAFHEFTTQNPSVIWMAIDRKSRKPRITYPPIRFVKMSGPSLVEGIEEHEINGVKIKVFSPAKTVADCFKYRNKIGMDVAIEALKEGWRNKKFTVDELLHYAEICRVKNVIMPYAETIVV